MIINFNLQKGGKFENIRVRVEIKIFIKNFTENIKILINTRKQYLCILFDETYNIEKILYIQHTHKNILHNFFQVKLQPRKQYLYILFNEK